MLKALLLAYQYHIYLYHAAILLIVKMVEGTFNKEKSLVGAFNGHCETPRRLVDNSNRKTLL